MFKLILFMAVLAGCQTAQQRSETLVRQRVGQLRHLSSYKPSWCQVETELTEPARARYEEMFPGESASDLTYVWRARETSCEVTPLKSSTIAKSQQGFLETALCLLMQVHYVNSPFDELPLESANIEALDERTHIKAGTNKDLGIYLSKDVVSVETRTKSRGVLHADYGDVDGALLPTRLEQDLPTARFVIEDIDYVTGGARPFLKSFWIAIGNEKPLRHSRVFFRDCR